MARYKKRHTGNMPAGLAAYWRGQNKKHKSHKSKPTHSRKASPVAKKKKHRKHSKKSHRRRSHGGGAGLIPNRHELYTLAGAAAYGWLESKAASDPAFLMNKIPRPIAQLGYAGNIALAGRIINRYAFKNEWVLRIANAAGLIAAYKMGKSGALATQADTVEGGYLEGDEDHLDAPDIGALSAEGEMSGVPYDDAVEADAHV